MEDNKTNEKRLIEKKEYQASLALYAFCLVFGFAGLFGFALIALKKVIWIALFFSLLRWSY